MTIADPAGEPRIGRRWIVSFVLVLAAHAGLGLLFSHHADDRFLPPDPPALLLDLTPVPSPAPVVETPPEPPLPAIAPEPPPPETLTKPPEPEPVQRPAPELPPPPKRSPPWPSPPRPSVPAPPRQAVTSPVPAPALTAPAPATASAEAIAAATTTWQSRLQAHLARFKRYPPEAQQRHQEGTPLLRFTMTRDGRVLASHLERSSGHEALDREAVDLLQRAQPLPPLPGELPRATIDLVVPLRFQLR